MHIQEHAEVKVDSQMVFFLILPYCFESRSH